MERNIALLIDFENIAAGAEKEGLGKFDVDKIISRIKDKGRILIARSYADWGRFARFKQGLLSANVAMFELTSHGMQDKNRADIAMVVDCLELAFTRDYIDSFVVVSGDSDFTPLVLKLKELNKHVIGIGTRRSTSRLIINACDEFIFYDSIVEKKPRARKSAPAAVPRDKAKVFDFIVEALEGMFREDPTPPHASVLKSAILRRQPDFNETDLGFSSFTRLLEAARDAGFVLLSRDKKSGGYTVDTVEDLSDEGAPRAVAAPSAAPEVADAAYDDPYLPEGSDDIVEVLHAEGLGPVSAPTRMALLEALVAAVEERSKKRRRVNIPFMQEDLSKRLRRTHPDLTANHIRGVLKALLRADVLMHKDGNPIRNATAQFTLTHDAPKLNRALSELYLRVLRDGGQDLTKTAMLASFLFGDAERTRDVEELVAWLDAPSNVKASQEKDADLDELDLDALLLTDDEDGDDVEDAKPEPAPRAAAKAEPKPEAKKPAAKKADAPAPQAPPDDAPAADEGATDAGDDGAESDAPAKKSSRSRARRKKPTAAAEDGAGEDTKAEAAPKPKAKPAAKKPAAPADDKDDLDLLLDVD